MDLGLDLDPGWEKDWVRAREEARLRLLACMRGKAGRKKSGWRLASLSQCTDNVLCLRVVCVVIGVLVNSSCSVSSMDR